MRISYLKEFVCFAKYLNMTKAAAELNIAQPTLSKHLLEMERVLKAKLIYRGAEMRLTNIGNMVLADAIVMLSVYEKMQEYCKAAGMGPDLAIRVLEPDQSTCGVSILYEIINEYSAFSSNVSFNFVPASIESPASLLDSGEIDCFIQYSCKNHEDETSEAQVAFTAIPLATTNLCLWTHRDSSFARKKHLYFSDIKRAAIMGTTATSNPLKSIVYKLADERGFIPHYVEYSSLTQSEFFLKKASTNSVYIITDDFHNSPLIQSRSDMIVRPFEDDDLTVTSLLIVKSDEQRDELQDFAAFASSYINK